MVKQANDLKDNVYIPLMTSRLRFGERIVSNRAGRVEAVETQLSRLILEVRGGADVEATAALVKCTLEPHHPKGDVEVVILKATGAAHRARDDEGLLPERVEMPRAPHARARGRR